jgi:hypothetical protein
MSEIAVRYKTISTTGNLGVKINEWLNEDQPLKIISTHYQYSPCYMHEVRRNGEPIIDMSHYALICYEPNIPHTNRRVKLGLAKIIEQFSPDLMNRIHAEFNKGEYSAADVRSPIEITAFDEKDGIITIQATRHKSQGLQYAAITLKHSDNYLPDIELLDAAVGYSRSNPIQ